MNTRKYITARDLRARLGKVSAMTLWRWEHQPALAFPKPVYINGRKYYDLDELEEWVRNRPAPTTSIGRTLLLAALVIYGPSILVRESSSTTDATIVAWSPWEPPSRRQARSTVQELSVMPAVLRTRTGY